MPQKPFFEHAIEKQERKMRENTVLRAAKMFAKQTRTLI